MDENEVYDKIEMEIVVTIRQPQRNYQGIELRQKLILKPQDFISIAEILGRFNRLADVIQAEQQKVR